MKSGTPKNPLFRFVALAAAGVLLFSGCAASGSNNNLESLPDSTATVDAPAEVRVSGPASPPSLPILRMIDTDALGDTDIVFERWGTADQLTAAVTGGNEFIAAPLTTGASLAQNGAGIQLLNVSAWAVMGVVTNDETVQSIEDLAGKQVHIAMRASAVDYTMQLVIAAHGLDSNVEIAYIDPLSGPEQFLAGQISTLVTVEPQITMIQGMAPGARSIVDFEKEWAELTSSEEPLPTAGTFMNADFAEQHPDTVSAFRDAYAEAAAWVAANPEEAGALAAENLGLPGPVVTAAIPKISWDAVSGTDAKPAVDLYFEQLFVRWPESVGGALPGPDFYLK